MLGLGAFHVLCSRLRAELEPLDEIREQLDLAPVQLQQLEFALHSWGKRQGKEVSSLPDEVERASALLRKVKSLREAVMQADGEKVEKLLHEHLPDVERCADVEALLQEAQRLRTNFRRGCANARQSFVAKKSVSWRGEQLRINSKT